MNSRRRILFISSWYPSAKRPIEGIFVREHARAAKLYHDVSILSLGLAENTDDKASLTENVEDGMRVFRYTQPLGAMPKVRFLRRLWQQVGIAKRVADILGGIDLIHTHTYHSGIVGVILGRRLKIPVVITEHWSGFHLGGLTRIEKFKARWAMRHAQVVVPVSEQLQQDIRLAGVRANFKIIPNPVDNSLFHYEATFKNAETNRRRIVPTPESIHTRGSIDSVSIDADLYREDKTLFAFRTATVGSLIPLKNIDVLLEALHILNSRNINLYLDIIGDGGERKRLELLSTELNISHQVHFRGTLPKAEIAKIFGVCDFYIHPSRWENLSCATAEALCAGLPVAAADIPGQRVYIDETNGILVTPNSAEALADGIQSLCAKINAYDRAKISNDTAARFGMEKVGSMLNDLYCSLLFQNKT